MKDKALCYRKSGDDSMYEALMEIMEPRLVLRDKTKAEEGVQKG